MHSLLLSLALCVAVQGVPVHNQPRSANTVDAGSSILLGRSGYIIGDTGAGSEILPRADETSDDLSISNPSPILADLDPALPSATSVPTSSTVYDDESSSGEEDPELFRILQHVEEILNADASSADEQVQWILDAIVHHKESLRESREDLWSAEELVSFFDAILLDGEVSDEEKVEIIFDEIVLHTMHKEKAEMPVHEPVLYRIKAILYGQAPSQKKIKRILNEIADYLNSKTGDAETGFGSSQVAIGEEISFEEGEYARELRGDVDWDASDFDEEGEFWR